MSMVFCVSKFKANDEWSEILNFVAFCEFMQNSAQKRKNSLFWGKIQLDSTQIFEFSLIAVVVKWQTRYFQAVVSASSCEFKSRRRHQRTIQGSLIQSINPCKTRCLRGFSVL